MTTSANQGAAPAKSSVLAWPWFPFVAAIYPLWFIYLYNIGQVSIRSVIAASVIAIAVVAAAYLGMVRLTRSRAAAAIGAMILVVAFYLYGPLHARVIVLSDASFLPRWLAAVVRAVATHGVFSALVLAFCVLCIWKAAHRFSGDSLRLTGALNVGAAALALLLAWRLGDAIWQDRELENSMRASDHFAGRETSVLGYNPDIYYIIVDGYARADVLRDHYAFDNTPFLSELSSRGFSVNDHSSANYYWTFLSLASSLNYDYLQNFAAPMLADPAVTMGRGGFARVARLLQDNRAAHYLRARGYRFVHLQSSAPETVRNPFADEQVGCAGRLFDDEYFRTLAEITWVQALGSLATSDLAECHKLRLKSLGDQASQEGPKLVFAHFLPPHHPYLFDHEGNVLKHVTISNQFDFQARLWEDKKAYVEQLRYVNQNLLAVIDRIKAESKQPPIIIVQSDHGPNLVGGLSGDEAKRIRFANFAAYLLPGAEPGTIPKDCAPVNQFRFVFNHYFDAGLPILPNRNFYSSFGTPLEMREIAPVLTAQESR